MTDEKKEIEQALEAAAMELKAKGAAVDPEAAHAENSGQGIVIDHLLEDNLQLYAETRTIAEQLGK